MICPHCEKKVSLFSKNMNSWSKEKLCPHCNKSVRYYVNLKIVFLLLIPAIILAFLLRPSIESLGVSGSLATGIVTGGLILMSMRLKKYEA